MFSRKHPYLFFILVFISITSFSSTLMLFLGNSKKKEFINSSETVGIIEIKGIIEDSKEVLELLKELRENNKIKSILLRIESPGGAVGPSQEIYQEVLKTKKQKKVIVSFGTIGTSGAYYIASAADGIMAVPGTVTGSIGVLMVYNNFQELLSKIGLSTKVIKSVQYKDIGSPNRQMSDAEKKILQDFVEKLHTQFINDIAYGRNMELLKVQELADGRIYTGEEARDLKLIDKLGNYQDAIEWAGRVAGIKGKINTYYPQKNQSFMEKILDMKSLSNISKVIFHPSSYAAFLYAPSL